MSREVTVAVGALIAQREGLWRLLVAQRPHDTVLPGLWELPGGKVEPGESLQDCVVREFMEELALGVRVTGALEPISHAYAHAQVTLHPFLCAWAAGEPRCVQVEAYRWVSAQELACLPFPAANDELMRRLGKHLEQLSGGVEAG